MKWSWQYTLTKRSLYVMWEVAGMLHNHIIPLRCLTM